MSDMTELVIEVPNTMADIDKLLELVGSGMERIYIAVTGYTTVGAIEIMGARYLDDELQTDFQKERVKEGRESIKSIHVEGRRWFDSINGNTYHSARVLVDGVLEVAVPFQYGYGDQYVYSAQEELDKLGILPIERYANGALKPLWQEARDRGFEFSYAVRDVTKKEAERWGMIRPGSGD